MKRRVENLIVKVLVLNQYNSDNIGDKLIGETITGYLSSEGMDITIGGFAQMLPQSIVHSEKGISIIDKGKKCCPPWLKYMLLYKKRIRSEMEKYCAADMDAIVIGGGQLIKQGGVFPYCFRDWANYAVRHDIPLFIYGVGVDDNMGKKESTMYKTGFENARAISCRDKQSADNLRKITDRDIVVWPDVVFSIGTIPGLFDGNNLVVMPYDYSTAHSHFNTLSSRKRYYNDLLIKIKSEKYNELLLSSTTSSDLNECYRFGKFLEKKNIAYRIVQIQDFQGLVKLYSGAGKVYSGRMHALIIGLLCGIEIEPVEISGKIRDFRKNYINGKVGRAETIKLSKNGLRWLQTQIVNND